jgi:hypothetical protein
LVSERAALERIANLGKKYQERQDLKINEIERIFGNISWPGVLYVMAKAGGGALSGAGSFFLTTYRRVKIEPLAEELASMGFQQRRGTTLRETISRESSRNRIAHTTQTIVSRSFGEMGCDHESGFGLMGCRRKVKAT